MLAVSVTRLKEVDLFCTLLTRDHMNKLVDQISKFTKLELVRLQATSSGLLSHDQRKMLSSILKLECDW